MYLQGTYYSNELRRENTYVAVLPKQIDASTKALFLLHGFSYDANSWSLHTPLVEYAKTYNIAFFCPNANNSFYTDHIDGTNYGKGIGEEFYLEMKKTFCLSFERAKTAIAGFSMGGYGAVLLGLRFAKYYSLIGGFSPAFVFYKKERNDPHYNLVFAKGDYGSENDCLVRYQELLDTNQVIPPIEFSCGTEDPLCEQTDRFIDSLREIDPQAKVHFRKQPGFHDFSLWKADLEDLLEKWQ